VPKGARLRLAANYALPLTQIRRAMDIAKTKFRPTSITFLNRASEKGTNIDINGNIIQEDLRDPIVQEKFIKKYLSDYEVEEDVISRVFALNRKYNAIVEETDNVRRNVRWKLKSLEWDNLFNYGEGNRIDFEDMNGVVGIFGKNYSGKSSIVDSLLYTMYNSTSKGNRRNYNSINENKPFAEGRAEIEIGNTSLNITRRSEKYIKRLKGEETEEAKTLLTFSGKDLATDEEESLNGLDRNDTDKNIRNWFGTMDDFLLTSMASQLGSLSFIGEGSTKRKEILAKFLDLEIFEKKYRLAKEEALELKTVLKKLEEIDFDEEVQVCVQELDQHNAEVENQLTLCKKYKEEIVACDAKLQEIQAVIDSIPAELIDIEEVQKELTNNQSTAKELVESQDKLNSDIDAAMGSLDKIANFIDTLGMDEVEIKHDLINNRRQDIEELLGELQEYESKLEVQQKKIKLLNEVPCGDKYPECKFIKDAFAALETIGITKEHIQKIKNEKGENQRALDKLDPDQVADYMAKYKMIIEKRDSINKDVARWKLQYSESANALIVANNTVAKCQEQVEQYNKDKELIDSLERNTIEKKKCEKSKATLVNKLDTCEEALASLYRENGSIQQKIDHLNEQKQSLEDTREEFMAYDLFMNCVGANGIPLDITKNKLPLINAEIASVLANIVDFQVFVENQDKKLDIYIKHPKYNARPIEMGSGAEKTIASMAIRLALLNVSSLPKGDLFILDEPGTALDEENMEGFIRILDLIKSHFKTVLLISHLDSLKDAVDSQICIDKKDGFAHVYH
jgi:exonuclease SbcC